MGGGNGMLRPGHSAITFGRGENMLFPGLLKQRSKHSKATTALNVRKILPNRQRCCCGRRGSFSGHSVCTYQQSA